jgi:hypothetical protein
MLESHGNLEAKRAFIRALTPLSRVDRDATVERQTNVYLVLYSFIGRLK